MNFDLKVDGKKLFLNGEKLTEKKNYHSRFIYYSKDYAVKLETDQESCRHNMYQCQREYEIWHTVNDIDKKYFVPILDFGHSEEYDYVIQPRIKMIEPENIREVEEAWETVIKRVVKEYDLGDIFYLRSGRMCNWCFSNGQPIIHDYGL